MSLHSHYRCGDNDPQSFIHHGIVDGTPYLVKEQATWLIYSRIAGMSTSNIMVSSQKCFAFPSSKFDFMLGLLAFILTLESVGLLGSSCKRKRPLRARWHSPSTSVKNRINHNIVHDGLPVKGIMVVTKA